MDVVAMNFELDDRHVEKWRDVCDQLLDADTPMTAGDTLGLSLGLTAVAGIVQLDCKARHQGLTLARSRARVARGGPPIMGLSVVTSGEALITTNRGEHVLRAGELCLLSSLEPFSKRLSANYHEQFLYLPTPVAMALGRNVPVMSQRVLVAPRRGLGSVLADSVTSLMQARGELDRREWGIALGALFELATGVFGEPDEERVASSARDVHRARALRHIDAHLRDPELSPTRIALGLGLSIRYLHLLFEDGDSVGATILAKRLDRCRAALADPAERDRSISEIAYHWGFNDAAHFSRTFKARFGMSPRDARSV